MYFFRFHIGDFEVITKGLDMTERGAYVASMTLYFSTERPLTSNRKRLFGLLNAKTKRERNAVERCLSDFFSLTADGYVNPAWDREIREMAQRAERARINGAKGGRPSKTETESVLGIGADKLVTGTAEDDFSNPPGLPNDEGEQPNGFDGPSCHGNPMGCDDENLTGYFWDTQKKAPLTNTHKKEKEDSKVTGASNGVEPHRMTSVEPQTCVNGSPVLDAGLQGGGVPGSIVRAGAASGMTPPEHGPSTPTRARGQS